MLSHVNKMRREQGKDHSFFYCAGDTYLQGKMLMQGKLKARIFNFRINLLAGMNFD
jgi:hypothetical protein